MWPTRYWLPPYQAERNAHPSFVQAIQLAKLSGFYPIITTASLQHAEFLQSLGATHVLDRNTAVSMSLPSVTDKPIDTILDTIGVTSTQTEGLDVLAAGGRMSILNPIAPGLAERGEAEGKKLIHVFGVKQFPPNYECLKGLYQRLTPFLEEGNIKVRLRG